MSKTVVLAEKPSVGRDIARVLNCNKKGNGYFEGSKYIVTWALGHLVTLADPEVYDDKLKTWKLEDLPMLPDQLKLVVIKKTGKQFNAVKTQLTRKDVSEIVVATDAGREGELVARWIIEKSRVNKPVKRLWISSVTDKAINDGFKNLKPGKQFENLYLSAVARSEADWYVGLNATRALTTKFNAQLSSGRVQTPTLEMIALREEEIKKFKPKDYYRIQAKTNKGFTLTWNDPQTKDTRTFSKEKAEKLVKELNNKQAEVVDIDKKHKKNFAPQLYDLTELQRDANRIFNYSGKETLSIMQKLYEQHKVLTYPRTDSKYISTDIVPTLKDRLKACGVDQYATVASRLARGEIKTNKSFVDDNKVSDHHAIIPTEQPVYLSELNDRERKIYDLVVKRFLAVLSPAFEYEQTTLTVKVGNERFTAKGKNIKKQGWKEIYNNQYDDEQTDDKDQTLPQIQKGDVFSGVNVIMTKGQTKPPERFTEGSLLQAMENPVKYMVHQDKDLVKAINQTGGLGTVATRADIIEKLFNNFYMEKKGKSIFMTSKGRQLLDLVPQDLKSPTLTAEWEKKLEAIASGSLKKDVFIKEMKGYAKTVVHEIKSSDAKFKHDNMTGTKCPECGKLMLEVKGKMGRMLVCQDRSCGEKKNIAKKTNARCPNCHKRLELRGEGDGQMFTCVCGHREKLSTFNDRKKKEKRTKVSKSDVNKYMKNQQQEEFTNPALAEALAKFKKK
ncbi:DNA topoisomerase III [Aquibacillus halophilus]|uniref:DNA topoisomerase 3 n=1 Tax=Aquibacillus halophilus TaxID=930132 RepID=A0A6A8DEE5_9BACI|nr:DNA topoisomerase III [Aquibacillus halophilus]MRH44065.1 DNA topoisomerase III [Aquibacillus halophilus]